MTILQSSHPPWVERYLYRFFPQGPLFLPTPLLFFLRTIAFFLGIEMPPKRQKPLPKDQSTLHRFFGQVSPYQHCRPVANVLSGMTCRAPMPPRLAPRSSRPMSDRRNA